MEDQNQDVNLNLDQPLEEEVQSDVVSEEEDTEEEQKKTGDDCTDCNGTGLLNPQTLCSKCEGTGKY